MSIGEKLKQARAKANLTQEIIAEKVGVSRQTVSNWENGKSYPDIASIIILSDVYNQTLDSLLKGDSEIMKHLKESTDTTKSNKQLAGSFILAGLFCVALILVRIFVSIPRITGVIPNIIAIVVVALGVIIALAGSINIKKLSEQKTSNKALLKAATILLYVLIYIPLILVIPEAITVGFNVDAEWLNGTIRAATAIVLLIPAFALYGKLKYLFTD